MEITDEQGIIIKAAYVSSLKETQYRVINIILVVALCKTDCFDLLLCRHLGVLSVLAQPQNDEDQGQGEIERLTDFGWLCFKTCDGTGSLLHAYTSADGLQFHWEDARRHIHLLLERHDGHIVSRQMLRCDEALLSLQSLDNSEGSGLLSEVQCC